MTIKNVSWNKDDQLSDSKFQKMIDNDNYNYSLATTAPRGLLFVHNFPTVSEFTEVPGTPENAEVTLINNALILGKIIDESDRLIKVCISDCTINDEYNASSRRSVLFDFNFKTTSGTSVKRVDFFSEFRPFTSSSFQANWRTQAVEFLVAAPGPDFQLLVTARQLQTNPFFVDVAGVPVLINTPITIRYGTISLYDVGKA